MALGLNPAVSGFLDLQSRELKTQFHQVGVLRTDLVNDDPEACLRKQDATAMRDRQVPVLPGIMYGIHALEAVAKFESLQAGSWTLVP